tara:strand:- start:5679 stop:6266 length:588 start_codon:yes stop_codon:yes gene_type:complete
MAKNVNLNKDVFNKNTYPKVIDTKFKSLGTKTIADQVAEVSTPQEFFNMYNELFFSINQFGATNSHEFLIKTSSEYINFDSENEIIKLLQAEIAGLRQDLLESQQSISDFAKSIPTVDGIEIPEIEIPEIEPVVINIDTTTPTIPEVVPEVETISNEQRVIDDVAKYPKSTKNKRVERLNLSKSFIKEVIKDNDL